MSVSAPFIRRPIGTALMAVGLFLAGMVAYFALPVAPLPNADLPIIFVTASQPGADPDTMAETVTATLERHLGAIPGVNEMTSTSVLGRSTVILQFDAKRRPADAARDVQAAINAASVDLPSGLPVPPQYRKANPNQRPVLLLALTSETLNTQAIFDAADTVLAQRLAQIEGVAQATVVGAEKPAIRVQIDIKKLASMGLSVDDVRTAITQANVTQSTGRIDGPNEAAFVSVDDQLTRFEQYRDIRVRSSSGLSFRLGDIANVYYGAENDRQAAWFGDRRAVIVQILKTPGANVIETVDRIRSELPEIRRWLPPGIDVTATFDQTGSIRSSVHEVQFTLLLSIGLVILVVGLFLRRAAATWAAASAMPLALAGTFGAMWLLGFSLNNLTLMALTISVGFVVDDAIVMIENISRHREMGKPALRAALDGAGEVGFTIVSMTLSLVAVFVPLIFIGGLQGRFFQEFAVTLTVAILVSGVVSLTLTPMICGRWVGGPHRETRLDRWFDGPFNRITRGYTRSLGWVVGHRWGMLVLTLATIGATIWLYGVVPKGGLLPQTDNGLMRGFARASPDTSFQAMARKMEQVAKIIAADPAVESIGGITGGGGPGASSNNGQVFITLKPKPGRTDSAEAVLARLRPKLARIEGLQVTLFAEQELQIGGRGGRASYQVAVLSTSTEDLAQWVPQLVRRLQREPGFQDVSSDLERAGLDAKVVIDRDAAARLSLQPLEISTALNNAFSQRQVSTIYRERNQYRVVIEALPQEQGGPQDLTGIYVKGPKGAQIPLSAVARVEIVPSPRAVTHDGQFPSITVNFNLDSDIPLVEAIERVTAVANELGVPGDMRVEAAGFARITQQSSNSTPLLILAALVAIYIVLGMLYESWTQALTILSTLPSAGMGALLALLATGFEMSLVSVIGIILLMGIVKKNAIMMVDFALIAERRDGMAPREAILAACHERFRPITMTTLTALLGALPLAVAGGTGAELRQPLGVAVVGGLLVSQLLTLYTTPVIYLLLRGRRKQPQRLLPIGGAEAPPAAAE